MIKPRKSQNRISGFSTDSVLKPLILFCDWRGLTHKVPQGTVLGPILFLLYINDFNNCSQVLDFHLFADDSNLFYSNKNLKDLEQTINEELKNVSDWLDANKLSLNITKSNFVMFHPPQKRLLFSLNYLY